MKNNLKIIIAGIFCIVNYGIRLEGYSKQIDSIKIASNGLTIDKDQCLRLLQKLQLETQELGLGKKDLDSLLTI